MKNIRLIQEPQVARLQPSHPKQKGETQIQFLRRFNLGSPIEFIHIEFIHMVALTNAVKTIL